MCSFVFNPQRLIRIKSPDPIFCAPNFATPNFAFCILTPYFAYFAIGFCPAERLTGVKNETGELKGIFVSIVRNTKAKSKISKT